MAFDHESDRRLAIVVGAGGGLGRAFVEELRGEPGWDKVVGVGRRRPDDWPDDPRLPFLAADLLDEQGLADLTIEVSRLGVPGLILIATGLLHEPGLTPEKSMKAVTAANLSRLFEVNTVLPTLVCKHLAPLLPRHERGVIAALSARVGSVGDNRLGGWHAYRASKAALNMLIRCQAIELSRERPLAICAVLHPGTVDTPLSAPFARASRSIAAPREAAAKLLKVIHQLEAADSGGFFDYDGAPIPW